MRFVGVDSALRNTGLVILDQFGVLSARHHFKCPETTDHRALLWWREVAYDVLKADDVIAIEGLSFGSVGRSHILACVYGIWITAAYERGTVVFVVPPLRVKKWAVGDGKATKKQMIDYAKAALVSDIWTGKMSEHEADACSLCDIGWSAYEKLMNPKTTVLSDEEEEMLVNPKGTGILQAEGKSYFWGMMHGKE